MSTTQEKKTWAEAKEIKKLQKKFGQSEQGNFRIIDTIPVPHPYCITPKHVEVASDDHFGMLGESAIKDAEKKGAHCGTQFRDGGRCYLSYEQHGKALLIECKVDFKDADGKANSELHKWLLAIKDLAEKAKFQGFAFKDATGGKNE